MHECLHPSNIHGGHDYYAMCNTFDIIIDYNIFFDLLYSFILVNPRDLGRHALLKVSFLHGLGIIITWVMQLFVMSMMISNALNNNHDHHEYLMDGSIHIQGND